MKKQMLQMYFRWNLQMHLLRTLFDIDDDSTLLSSMFDKCTTNSTNPVFHMGINISLIVSSSTKIYNLTNDRKQD